MSEQNQLKKLVTALTPREKSEFLNAIDGKGLVQQRLKNVFENLNNPNVPLLKELDRREYYRHKNLLKAKLLEFLLQEHEKSFRFEADLHQQIRLARFLIHREQIELATEILEEAKAKADEFDFHFLFLECLNLERAINRFFLDNSKPELIRKSVNEYEKRLQLIAVEQEITTFHDLLIFEQQRKTDLPDPGFNFPPDQLSLRSRRNLSSIKALLAKFKNQKDEWKKYRKEVLEISEEKPLWKSIFPGNYLVALANYGSTLNLPDESAEMRSIIDRIEKFKPANEFERANSFQLVRYLELLVCLGQNDFRKASLLEYETEKKLGQYAGKLDKTFELTIYVNLAISLWVNTELNKSIKWTQRILKFKNHEARLDIQRFAYLFVTMLFADSKDEKGLERMNQIAYKPNRASVDLPIPYCKIMKLIVKLESTPNKAQQIAILHEIQMEMLAPDFPKQLGKEELTIWIEHRLTGKPLFEIVKSLS